MSELTRITHHIGGAYWTAGADRVGDVYNPATGKVTGQVEFASVSVVDHAVDVATAAQVEWRSASLAKRVQVLFSFREILNARKEEVAKLITAEHGKVLSDALGEVTRGLEVVEFACGIPHLLKGSYSEGASTSIDVYSKYLLRSDLEVLDKQGRIDLVELGLKTEDKLPDQNMGQMFVTAVKNISARLRKEEVKPISDPDSID
jgi:hypothetical protein